MSDERTAVDDVLDAEAGCRYHRALIAAEAQGACEAAYEEFRYDKGFPDEIVTALKTVAEADLSV